ncbi:esterase/lipase family protein [Leptospira ilyithenensis]|uniref:Alpha/beta hydrolase n=1 Tax=Leptospira ilyithenensis TaxID=2484901 RepID=A0A4R9LXN4_9LEPT|nr:alpha/beta hydrolase [Leptospira ilyithenensis]TGN14511.1 alpha/beta hydrolase [Leptospira ilyithenensis]
MFQFLDALEKIWAKILYFLPGHSQPEDCQGKDILIIPGHMAGKDFYRRLKADLDNLGFHVAILSTLRNPVSVEDAVLHLSKQILTAPNEATVIAHNTGGLLCLVLPDESRRKVKRLITLGTPFHGSHFFSDSRFSYWGFESDWVKKNYKNALFFPLFQPLSAIEDFSFSPQESTEFGQGRDLWFDIPGNYNLVRRHENLRTIREFLGTPKDPQTQAAAKASPVHALPKKIEVDFSKFDPANRKKVKVAAKKKISPKPKAKPTAKKPGVKKAAKKKKR